MRISSMLLGAALIGMGATAPATARDHRENSKAEAQLAKALEGRVAGKPVSCISQHNITSSTVYDGTAIVYRIGSTLYVNRPRVGQTSLDSDDILVSKTFGSQLCSLDTIKLVDRAARFQTGFVGLGEFVPYAKPKAVKG
ncbi:MAG: hypothetical protein WC729_06080 [Sphingomonas sp.]|uniref:hypothetical protein n=1 Tax=Sphingomonas sp. TaxID=28214 RepID=UPI00356AB5B8